MLDEFDKLMIRQVYMHQCEIRNHLPKQRVPKWWPSDVEQPCLCDVFVTGVLDHDEEWWELMAEGIRRG